MQNDEIEEKYMRAVLQLAGQVEPPNDSCAMVGAIVVADNRIAGKGYHVREHALHAEVIALREAGQAAQGSTLYTNLEPCTADMQKAFNRDTESCVDVIVKSGVKRVVIAMLDPNPLVNGRGAAELEKAGIDTTTGVLDHQARTVNRRYINYMQSHWLDTGQECQTGGI